MSPDVLRLVTINTWKADGDYPRRLALLGDQLAELEADVVCVQEALVAPEGSIDTAAALGRRLGMQVAFATARTKPRLVGEQILCSSSGLAILSREPLSATTRLTLPTDCADGERIAQLALLEHAGREVLLVNLHLSHLPGRDDLRQQQLAAILAHPWMSMHYGTRLVAGDFNTTPERLPELFATSPTWHWLNPAQHCATGPGGHCIDYILALTTAEESAPVFRQADVVLDRPDETGIYPSDHRGVMVELQTKSLGGVR